ncbi:hypothetical protein M378DRAFT_161889 [Amanita muscaria Koide BX008]|uniref:Uncharacterized protein n=1 Tax=Amanita muscaria (strain Koide BX008) TaxID=946122 RepID=A0A0C2TFE4_AMAMK|nr:hypothetical protein M378DRAFT_161889 [Amanita muscaria Koide BX008]
MIANLPVSESLAQSKWYLICLLSLALTPPEESIQPAHGNGCFRWALYESLLLLTFAPQEFLTHISTLFCLFGLSRQLRGTDLVLFESVKRFMVMDTLKASRTARKSMSKRLLERNPANTESLEDGILKNSILSLYQEVLRRCDQETGGLYSI